MTAIKFLKGRVSQDAATKLSFRQLIFRNDANTITTMTSTNRTTHHSSFSRRRFFKRTSTAIFAGALAPAQKLFVAPGRAQENASPKRVHVGSNIYGWGQYYQRMGKNVNENLDEVLSALRDAGYDYLEGFVDVNRPENNARFAERLKAKGLQPVCLYTGGRLHEAGKASEAVQKVLAAAKVCQQAGFSLIDCNPDPIGREKTDEELKTQASALAELGEGLKKLGLRLGVHNHTPEMAREAREFHHNLRQTARGSVGLCYDVHWVFRGGLKPPEVFREYGPRIVSFHLRQSREGIWWEDLDKGDVDYEAMARLAQESRLAAPYTVELAIENGTKITRTVVENHQRSREFVRRVFGS